MTDRWCFPARRNSNVENRHPTNRRSVRVGRRTSIFDFRFSDCRFFAASRANVDIVAERDFQRFEHVFFVEAEALAVGDVADVGAELAVGPEEIADVAEHFLDVIVLLDQRGDIAGGARGGNILQRLR